MLGIRDTIQGIRGDTDHSQGDAQPSSPARPVSPWSPVAFELFNLQHLPNTPSVLWVFRALSCAQGQGRVGGAAVPVMNPS